MEEIIVTLGSTKHGSFPVVDKTSGELRGTIRRKDLVVLLARRVFRKNPHEIFPPDIFLVCVPPLSLFDPERKISVAAIL